VPRPLEEDPEVLKVPFYHANIDADEVLFYHSGSFFSRAGIGRGFMTLHPQGVHHGPQPAAIEASRTKERTDEVGVMVETTRPVDRWSSWRRRGGASPAPPHRTHALRARRSFWSGRGGGCGRWPRRPRARPRPAPGWTFAPAVSAGCARSTGSLPCGTSSHSR